MFGEKQQEIETLRQRLDQATGQLAVNQVANQTAESVRDQLQAYMEGGQTLNDARSMAEAAVLATEQQKAVEDLSTQLIEEHGSDMAAAYRREHGPAIKQELHARFQQDGTYDKIAATAHEQVETDIRQELVDEEKARIEAELSDPAVRAAFIETSRARLRESRELSDFRAKVRHDLETAWTTEAQTQAKQDIADEEGSREAECKQQAREHYLDSLQGQNFRQGLAEKLNRTWRDKTVEEVQAELNNNALGELLAERATQEAEKLARENKARELLAQFEGVGIDVCAIERGAIVALYMGTVKEEDGYRTSYDDPYSSRYGRSERQVLATLECERKLTLVALGDGKLKVRADSLSESKSTWEKSLALEEGTVIVVGNVVRENGVATLERHIAADVNLYYDSDPATPETFSEMPVPLANVVIGGVSARKIDEVKGAGVKSSKKG